MNYHPQMYMQLSHQDAVIYDLHLYIYVLTYTCKNQGIFKYFKIETGFKMFLLVYIIWRFLFVNDY